MDIYVKGEKLLKI